MLVGVDIRWFAIGKLSRTIHPDMGLQRFIRHFRPGALGKFAQTIQIDSKSNFGGGIMHRNTPLHLMLN